MKNYYQVIGVSNYSSSEAIKKAYRKLSLKFHPDLNQGDEFYENMTKNINEAYNILSNSERKKQYDEILSRNLLGEFSYIEFENKFKKFQQEVAELNRNRIFLRKEKKIFRNCKLN